MSFPSLRRVPLRVTILLVAAAILATAATLLPAPRTEAVTHHLGFQASVDGDPGWYGSFSLPGAGPVWCIDAPLPAPDASFGYAPTDLPDLAGPTKAALAWLVGRYAIGADAVQSAAIGLAAHHLVRAPYPSGPLDVGRLGAGSLQGFGPYPGEVLSRARTMVADAVAHQHLSGPYRMALATTAAPPGATTTATATLTDGRGSPIVGVPVVFGTTRTTLAGPQVVTTGADGRARTTVRVAEGANEVRSLWAAPDLSLRAYAPTRSRGQRVIGPDQVAVQAVTRFDAVIPPGHVRVLKVGDAPAWASVRGARFVVRGIDAHGRLSEALHELVAGTDGRTQQVALPPGQYLIEEAIPPPGHDQAGPWRFDLRSGQLAEIRAENRTKRAQIALQKVDAHTGKALAGARFRIHYDHDRDGTFETHLPDITTTAGPTTRADLLPGRYRLVEVTAPAGYLLDATPHDITVLPGATGTVRVADRAAPVTVRAAKRDAVTGRAVPGAVYDLFAKLTPAPPGEDPDAMGEDPPLGAPGGLDVPQGHAWLGRATSDTRGALAWPGVAPGRVVCAREHRAPAGYRLDPALHCTDAPIAPGQRPSLALRDIPLDQAPPPTTSPPTTRPPTTLPPTTLPPTTLPPTTLPPTTLPPEAGPPPSTWPPVTTAPPAGPDVPVGDSPSPPVERTTETLARTGSPLGGLARLGGGLGVLGATFVALARRRRRA